MGHVVSFNDYRPPPRYDSLAWTEVRIYETDDPVDGTWTLIDTQAFGELDADPQDPAYRSFTTEAGTDVDLWYRAIFADANGDTSQPTAAVQNVSSSSIPFASVDELASILKIRSPTAIQTDALERVLATAAGEILTEIDLPSGSALAGWQLALAAEVNLERAVEHWREKPFGLVGLGDDLGGLYTSKNTWERYAHKLAPLKAQWGIA